MSWTADFPLRGSSSARPLLLTVAVALGAGISTGAKAGSNVELARVLDVEPVVRLVNVQVPVRDCYEIPARTVVEHHPRESSSTVPATIAGGVIGGLVGNNFGGGSGRDAARIFGTLVGAAVGNDMARQRQQYSGTARYVSSGPSTECTTRYQSRTEERLDGYRVTWEYNGRRHTTIMSEDPGDVMPVHVTVRPASR